MSDLSIELENSQTVFLPGETIRGRARWVTTEPPKKAVLRLLWYTQGKGTEDVGVVETVEYCDPGVVGHEAFEFAAPAAPWSFSGKLISLVWTLELIADGECVHRDITLSPTGREILLHGDTIVDAGPA